MKLNKCPVCNEYTLKDTHCGQKTKSAHYKFIKIRDVEKRDSLKNRKN